MRALISLRSKETVTLHLSFVYLDFFFIHTVTVTYEGDNMYMYKRRTLNKPIHFFAQGNVRAKGGAKVAKCILGTGVLY